MRRTCGLTLLFTLFLLLAPGGVGRAAAIVETGLSAGMNFTSLEDVDVGDAKTTYGNKTGWHFGLFVQSALGPLGVRAGAVYLDAGPLFQGLSENLDDPASLDDGFDVRYFVIPIDLQYRLATPGITPYLFAGPEIRFNVTAADDIEDDMPSTVWGGNIGVGVELGVPGFGFHLTPEFRYSFDLSGLTNNSIDVGDEILDLSDSYQSGTYHIRFHVAF